jgi:hypothetical protein
VVPQRSQAGHTRIRAATGAVTLIQCFGSALNLNIDFLMLFLDGVYLFKGVHPRLFRPVAGSSAYELQRLVEANGHSITDRITVGPRAGQKLFTLQTV